jgi:S1-C subfamily serine protease
MTNPQVVQETSQPGLTTLPKQPPAVPAQTATTSEAALLGVVGHATENGFEVTSVRSGSPAEDILLKPGDVISKINDTEVHGGREIESAIAASSTGAIKVTGLTQTAMGMIPFEREVKVR